MPGRGWRALLRWALDPAHREDVDADLAEEFEARVSESSPAAARRWYRRQAMAFAVRRLTNPSAFLRRHDHHEGRTMRDHLFDWLRDLRLAARTLRRTPAFAATAIGTLALAIGGTTAMFAVVNTVLLDPLPYPAASRLVHVTASAPGTDLPDEFGVAPEFFQQFRDHARLLEDVSTYNSGTSTLRTPDRVERIRMSFPTPTLFSTLGATPVLGRLPLPEDADDVALISHALWTSWFGQDPSVVGRAYSISGDTRTIIGVMGPEFRFPDDGTLLWIPVPTRPEDLQGDVTGQRLVARLSPGATPEALATELTGLAQQFATNNPGSASYARTMPSYRAVVRPLTDEMFGSVSRALWVLLGATAIVLLIACANVANLFTVRAEHRQRDLAVRRAIGASRGQIIRVQMVEALLVAMVAGALAVGLALVCLPAFLAFVPEGVPRVQDVRLGATTIAYALAVSVITALLCGVAPAIRASRPAFTRLREGGRGSTSGRRWMRDALVAGQTALALVLLIGAGLLMRSLWTLSQVDPGYDTADVFTFQIAPDRPELDDGPAYAQFNLAFMEQLRALPTVTSVGLVENVPLNEGTSSARFVAEGTTSDDEAPLLSYTFEAGDYFETMGIALIDGRALETSDHAAGRNNIVISRTAAALLWQDGRAVGRRIRPQGGTDLYTVVGVVEDVKQYSYRDEPQPLVYLPMVGPATTSWALSSPAYVIKTPRADTIRGEVRNLVREVAPEAPMYRDYTMDELAGDSMVQLSFTMLTLGVLSALALVLGGVGLYAVLSCVVASRVREIGVRLALGARAGQVRRMVIADGSRVVLAGVAAGVVVALAGTRALGSLLFGVEATDAATFVTMSAAMLCIGAMASYVPARRASRVDPILSLRGE